MNHHQFAIVLLLGKQLRTQSINEHLMHQGIMTNNNTIQVHKYSIKLKGNAKSHATTTPIRTYTNLIQFAPTIGNQHGKFPAR